MALLHISCCRAVFTGPMSRIENLRDGCSIIRARDKPLARVRVAFGVLPSMFAPVIQSRSVTVSVMSRSLSILAGEIEARNSVSASSREIVIVFGVIKS